MRGAHSKMRAGTVAGSCCSRYRSRTVFSPRINAATPTPIRHTANGHAGRSLESNRTSAALTDMAR